MHSRKISVATNAAYLAEHDQEAFALLRRQGFGASDSSILLGVNKWTTIEQLIEQKNSPTITPEEIEVGNKPNVRMGRDCEEIILKKFAAWAGDKPTQKPDEMFRLEICPALTVNYDGMVEIEPDVLIPVECKTVSMFADKYWDKTKAIKNIHGGSNIRYGSATSVQDHIQHEADAYGIPAYYYTQIQQQLMGVDANYAYLAALFVKTWELCVYKIYEDEYVQSAIIARAAEYAPKCNAIPVIS